jgi:hypothetical protein
VDVCRDDIGRYSNRTKVRTFDQETANLKRTHSIKRMDFKKKKQEHVLVGDKLASENSTLNMLYVNILARGLMSIVAKVFKYSLIYFFAFFIFFAVLIFIKEYDYENFKSESVDNLMHEAARIINKSVLIIYHNSYVVDHDQSKKEVMHIPSGISKNLEQLLVKLNAAEYSIHDFNELLNDVEYQYKSQKKRILVALEQGSENGNIDILNDSLKKLNLTHHLVLIGAIESDFDNSQISHSGSMCLMQMSKIGSDEIGVDRKTLLNDAQACSDAGSELLSKFSRQFNGDITLAVAGYNIGNSYVGGINKNNNDTNYVDIKRALQSKLNKDLVKKPAKDHLSIKKAFDEKVSYLPLFLASVIIADENGYLSI